MNTIHINKTLDQQFGEDIRKYLFSHTINNKNYLSSEINQLARKLQKNFNADNHPCVISYADYEYNYTTRMGNLFVSGSYFKRSEQILLKYTYKKLSSILGKFSVLPADTSHPHYNYAQIVTSATYLITLGDCNLTSADLKNLATNCHRLLSYQDWLVYTILYVFALETEYFRGKLCCGNSKRFTSSLLNWFDYLEILEFRIFPHACTKAFKKFEENNYNSKLVNTKNTISYTMLARKAYSMFTHFLGFSCNPIKAEKDTSFSSETPRSRLPIIEDGFITPSTTMALWNLRQKCFPKEVITGTFAEEADYNHPKDEEAYMKIVQRYRTILDKESLSPKERIQNISAIVNLRKKYIPNVLRSSANCTTQCMFRTTEELDNLFIDFCSNSLKTIIRLSENETDTDCYDVIQLFYLIKNEIENICLDDTRSKPLYEKQLVDMEDNYICFIRTKLKQLLEERNIPNTRAFIMDLSLFDTVNSLELAETLLSCDPAKIDDNLLVDCCQFICHSSTKTSTDSYCSVSNQVFCIAFTTDEIPKHAPLNRISSFRDLNDLDETEHKMIETYADMIYKDLTDIHRQAADIFINYPI